MRISDWSSDVCSSDLAAGTLLKEHPDCYLQTHLSENRREIETVKRLFSWAASYTAVYERFGLLGPRSLFGHCIHLDDGERSEEHTSELQSLMRISYAVFCLKKKTQQQY